MTLSEQERQTFDLLWERFDHDDGRLGRWRRRRHEHERTIDGLGWAALIAGFILVLALLQVSVLASFAAFLVSVAGLGVVLTGGTPQRVAASIERRRGERTPPDPRGRDPI